MDMKNVWVYEIIGQAKGIVLAKTQEEARQKVREAYERHHDPLGESVIYIWSPIFDSDTHWFADSPDIVEISDFD